MTPAALTDQSTYLSILTATPAADVKALAETLLAQIADVQVIASRTGLAMVPFADSVKGVTFHLGETLLAEAYVRVEGQEGYAACLGRDLEQALALAIFDAILQSSEPPARAHQATLLDFVAASARQQQAEEAALLRKIEATRVELETF